MSEPNNIDPIRRPDEFPSRTEAILSDAIGLEGYEIEPPRSRIEKLLIEFVGILGASIEVTMDDNFVLSAKLLNKDGDTLGTVQTIDLPIEATVVDGRYDSTNKKLILELQNGNTIDIPIADLINGLQEEITSQNPLDADLVDDSIAAHKFTTASDISKLAGIEAQANKTVVDSSITDGGTNPVTGGSIFTALAGKQSTIDTNNKLSADLVDDSNATHKFATAAQLTQIQTNETNILSLEGKTPKVYGFRITKADSNPETRVTYLYDAVGMTPARMNYTTGEFDYGSWEDVWFIKRNKPCALKFDGTLDYYLDETDYTKKADGTDSDLYTLLTSEPSDWSTTYKSYFILSNDEFVPVTGETAPTFATNTYYTNSAYEGNFMATMPVVWIKRYEDNDYIYTLLSDVRIDFDYHAYAHDSGKGIINDYIFLPMFKGVIINNKLRSIAGQNLSMAISAHTSATAARANGDGWQCWDWAKYQLMMALLTLISKSTDTGRCFGRGFQADSVNVLPRSNSTKDGRFAGVYENSNSFVKVFHIEGLWGMPVEALEGAGFSSVNGDFRYRNVRPYGESLIGNYASAGQMPSSGFVSSMKVGEYGLLPSVTDGSKDTYYCGFYNRGSNSYTPAAIDVSNSGIQELTDRPTGIYTMGTWFSFGFSRWYITGSPVFNREY